MPAPGWYALASWPELKFELQHFVQVVVVSTNEKTIAIVQLQTRKLLYESPASVWWANTKSPPYLSAAELFQLNSKTFLWTVWFAVHVQPFPFKSMIWDANSFHCLLTFSLMPFLTLSTVVYFNHLNWRVIEHVLIFYRFLCLESNIQ